MTKYSGEMLTLPKMSGSFNFPQKINGNLGAQTIHTGEGGTYFTPGNALELTEDGTLNVLTATDAESDNTLPITSAAVAATVGNIEILLKTI